MALEIIDLVHKESGVPYEDFGLHGSTALEMHAPECDIDFVVYGTENFRKVEQTLQILVNQGTVTYIAGNRIEAARKFVGKYKGKIWMYNATKKPEEIKGKFGDYTYTPLAPVRFWATVCDDTETMYRPAIYKISNYKPMDPQSELDTRTNPNIKSPQTLAATETSPEQASKSKSQAHSKKPPPPKTAQSSTKLSSEQPLQKKSTYGQPKPARPRRNPER